MMLKILTYQLKKILKLHSVTQQRYSFYKKSTFSCVFCPDPLFTVAGCEVHSGISAGQCTQWADKFTSGHFNQPLLDREKAHIL